jgi:hypothetical protein
VAYSNNVATGGGDFNAAFQYENGSGDTIITSPDLALDDDTRPYIAYSINNGATDTVKVQCRDDTATDCYRDDTTLTVPAPDGAWDVFRNVHLEMIGLQPNVVFAATNDSLDHTEVWWYHPDPDGANDPPAGLTNTLNHDEGEPLIVEENSSIDVPVVAWRIFEPPPPMVQGLSSQYCFGDVYYTFGSTGTRYKVFDDQDTCDNEPFDLAANGQWVAGAWADIDPDVSVYHAVWTTFNAYRKNVPIVLK